MSCSKTDPNCMNPVMKSESDDPARGVNRCAGNGFFDEIPEIFYYKKIFFLII